MTSKHGTRADAMYLAIGGLGFLGLATFFLWRDLALPPALILLGASALAALAAVLGQPRGTAAAVVPAALLATTVIGGGLFAVDPRPLPLWGLMIALAGSIAAVIHAERGTWPAPASQLSSPLQPARLSWYAAGLAFLVTSRSLYFQFLTVGVASDAPARRMILTIVWLAVGLALFIADRHRRSATLHVGVALIAVALIKTVAYDTTHLHGGLRVLVLAAVGALLLAGARVLHGDHDAASKPPLARDERPAPVPQPRRAHPAPGQS